MYYNHFGLSQPPFKITPNIEFFFAGGNRGPILEALIYAVAQGEGIIKVTGEVGSGKTMLCHMLPARLPPHIVTVYIANPSVSPTRSCRRSPSSCNSTSFAAHRAWKSCRHCMTT